ncbi:MAG TPA: VWA domain-containing protein [Bacillota bacterium]|nr:VWA domain-containing protein [Bacillota bacterium]
MERTKPIEPGIEKAVLYFVRQLRRAGVKVTLAEVLDCFRALALVNWDRDTFYTVLQGTLAKAPRDLVIFERLFRLVFQVWQPVPEQSQGNDREDGTEDGGGPGLLGEGGKGTGGARTGKPRPGYNAQRMLQLITLGTPQQVEDFIREGIESLGPVTEDHLLNPQDSLRLIKVFLEWKDGEWQLEKLSRQSGEAEVLAWQQKLQAMEEQLGILWEQELLKSFGDKALELFAERINLQELDFYRLNQQQIGEMKRIISRMANKLGTRLSRRWMRSKRGDLDLGRTLRKAMSTGGVPMFPAFRSKKPTKPELVILCDLSGSVAVFSEFMLQLVYSMQRKFRLVRSFVFVDTVEEISVYFRTLEIEDALVQVYNKVKYSKTGFSHYGETILAFEARYGEVVTHNTTVIVLGDGRNNYQKPGLAGWLNLQERAKRVIWLNPEPRESWNREDSIMDTFALAATQVFECRNLRQLEQVTREIF